MRRKKRTSIAGTKAFNLLMSHHSTEDVRSKTTREKERDARMTSSGVFDAVWSQTTTPRVKPKVIDRLKSVDGRKRIGSEDWREHRASVLSIMSDFDAVSLSEDAEDEDSFDCKDTVSDEGLENADDLDELEKALDDAEKKFRRALRAQAYWFRRAFKLRQRVELLHARRHPSSRKSSDSDDDGLTTNDPPGLKRENDSKPPHETPSSLSGLGQAAPHVHRSAVMIFNRNPKRGVVYAQQANICSTPGSIAQFLLNTPGLSKRGLGDYLAHPHPINVWVADSYFKHAVQKTREWQDAVTIGDLHGALNSFFSRIHPPGEAGPLERLINRFTTLYYDSNPTQFESKDAVYVLTHALLMLNGSLHKKAAAKYRMSKEAFVKDVRASPDCKNVPKPWLEAMYVKLKTSPLQVHGSLSVNADKRHSSRIRRKSSETKDSVGQFLRIFPTKHGWAVKENKEGRTRQRRYFVLTNHMLYYFKHENDNEPHCCVPVHGCDVSLNRSSWAHGDNGAVVTISHGSGAPLVQIHKEIESRSEFRMRFDSMTEAKEWYDALKLELSLSDHKLSEDDKATKSGNPGVSPMLRYRKAMSSSHIRPSHGTL